LFNILLIHPLPNKRGFLFVGIGNIFLISNNGGVKVHPYSHKWKYISKTSIPLRSIDKTPHFKIPLYTQKKIFGKFF